MAATILVADNDPSVLNIIEASLRLDGFEVALARDGREALDRAFKIEPDLVLLDLLMPEHDGFEVLRQLRADVRTVATPVIILTCKSDVADKVVGLSAGADDYVVKPFDPVELGARVRTTLRRSRQLRAVSPLTGLPGNAVITEQLAGRMESGRPTAVVYADLNDFKSYNDRYGFQRGDGVIVLTADILRRAVRSWPGTFLGHIGGDDFLVITEPGPVVAICEQVIRDFDGAIAGHYDADDRNRGYVQQRDRRGVLQRFPLVSITLGVASTAQRDFDHPRQLVEVATEMKTYLKQRAEGSGYAMDGRRGEPPSTRWGHACSGARR